MKTSEFYRYSRQLRQEVDQAISYFHDINQQPLVDTRANRIRSARPQTAVFRGMIGHSMVNSKILLLHRPKVSGTLGSRGSGRGAVQSSLMDEALRVQCLKLTLLI